MTAPFEILDKTASFEILTTANAQQKRALKLIERIRL